MFSPPLENAHFACHLRLTPLCGCRILSDCAVPSYFQIWGYKALNLLALVLFLWYNASMEYKSNCNVVYSCKYHVVWCPKYRRKVLVGDIADRLRELIVMTANEVQAEIIEREVMPDHVHLLIEVNPQFGIHKAIKHIKGRTSFLLRDEFPSLKSRLPCLWTNSYFVSTVGGAPIEAVKQYIEKQELYKRPKK